MREEPPRVPGSPGRSARHGAASDGEPARGAGRGRLPPDDPDGPAPGRRPPGRVRSPGRQRPLPDAVASLPRSGPAAGLAPGRDGPDAAQIRAHDVPAAAPPFDDEPVPVPGAGSAGEAAGRPGRHRPIALVAGQQAGPGWADPGQGDSGHAEPGRAQSGRPQSGRAQSSHAEPGHAEPGHAEPGAAAAGPAARREIRPGPGGRTREADRWPSQFAQVLAETLAGSRPARQITPWTTAHARQRIRQLGPALATGRQPRLRRVITTRPAEDVVELTVVVSFGPHLRVLAVRLERAGPQLPGPEATGPQARTCGPGWLCTAVEAA